MGLSSSPIILWPYVTDIILVRLSCRDFLALSAIYRKDLLTTMQKHIARHVIQAKNPAHHMILLFFISIFSIINTDQTRNLALILCTLYSCPDQQFSSYQWYCSPWELSVRPLTSGSSIPVGLVPHDTSLS